jgi:Protein of unknown function (DUF2971)
MSEDQIISDFVASLFDADVETMDDRYAGASLYKYVYFPDKKFRERFLTNPTIKFAVKSELNDPFELSKRWKEFTSLLTIEKFVTFFEKYMNLKFSDRSYFEDNFVTKFHTRHPEKSRRVIRRMLHSPQGKIAFENMRRELSEQIRTSADTFYQVFGPEADSVFENLANTTGIFSLSESHDNPAMWGLYAGAGRGFVIEFNMQHDFFRSFSQTKSRMINKVRKVHYRDHHLDEFWQNPLYFFLVKNTEFSFEKEWRLICGTEVCDEIAVSSEEKIYLQDVRVGMIKSVIFGYRYSREDILIESRLIRDFDDEIGTSRMELDQTTGKLLVAEL